VSADAVVFDRVYKSFPMYHDITGGGFKSFILRLPSSLWAFKKSRFDALMDVSFSVRRGESLAIQGRNGAGKSTTLGLIAGVMDPTGGKISVNGRVSPLLELGGGFHNDLSGRENILLNGVLLGLSRREIKQKVDQIIDFSGIEKFIDQPLRTYSSGMVARLGFSVVAHLDPEILLIDEILAVGDMDFQKKCLEKLAEFKKSGVTMILVSHNLSDIEGLCERVLWIENHRVRALGPAADILKAYKAT
jgi:lipopolysaccharide transport system ATP-binding protein